MRLLYHLFGRKLFSNFRNYFNNEKSNRESKENPVTEAQRPKGLASTVCYRDPNAAYRWLEEAFGFEPLFALVDADGKLAHGEMTFGASVVMRTAPALVRTS